MNIAYRKLLLLLLLVLLLLVIFGNIVTVTATVVVIVNAITAYVAVTPAQGWTGPRWANAHFWAGQAIIKKNKKTIKVLNICISSVAHGDFRDLKCGPLFFCFFFDVV